MCASTQIRLSLISLSLSGTLSHQEQKHRLLLQSEKPVIQSDLLALQTRRTNSAYSKEFKEKVQSELRNKVSINYLKAKYNLSPSTLKQWSVECGMAEKKSVRRIISREELNALQEKYKGTKDPEIKELLEQLEYAKMENDILKKLATLVQARKEKEQQQSEN